jgi:hypothetical protein
VKTRIALIALTIGIAGCASFGQIAALRRVAFSLGTVQDGRISGVPLSRIASYRDLSTLDLGRLALGAARKDMPLDFQLNVRADNPADNRTTASMTRLEWTLFIDDKETIEGTLDSLVSIPAGARVLIPLRMRLNLFDFFEGSAEDLVDLAAGLAGLNADPTRLTLRATPTINTPLGRISYPSPITIATTTVGGAGR